MSYPAIRAGTSLLLSRSRSRRSRAYQKQNDLESQKSNVMSLDDALFVVIVSGLGLCAAYFREEYIAWREHRATEMRRETSMRELHINTLLHMRD